MGLFRRAAVGLGFRPWIQNLFQEDGPMSNNVRHCCIRMLICFFLACAPRAYAQQTLGGITGTVTDSSGAVVPAATVTIVGDQTKLTRTLQTTDTGRYDFVNLPIGNYTITFNRTGFQSLNIPS